MTSHSASMSLPRTRRPRVATLGLSCLALLATACLPASPTAPQAGRLSQQLPVGAYYLRTVDGAKLPLSLPGGLRIESGFLVSDSTDAGTVGFGESVGRDRSASVRLATGSARVVGQDHRAASIAQLTWKADAGVRADSVLWGADSVIVYRTGAAPSVAGAGHRLVYTRAIAADTI